MMAYSTHCTYYLHWVATLFGTSISCLFLFIVQLIPTEWWYIISSICSICFPSIVIYYALTDPYNNLSRTRQIQKLRLNSEPSNWLDICSFGFVCDVVWCSYVNMCLIESETRHEKKAKQQNTPVARLDHGRTSFVSMEYERDNKKKQNKFQFPEVSRNTRDKLRPHAGNSIRKGWREYDVGGWCSLSWVGTRCDPGWFNSP
ncbi:hypothetical protein BO82DRAFT_168483 [Aspergillus uvarum CBS 121591]|uniref:Uncharacterized protein n=1 Tax=Aspergillus uvarum CBS 121591 TaxID=1448315 RepID=A0A319C154_9EURO|nr:hypothetical protein BO82DRAFT_168483 [Aspergillus uvarum CBS 121591]PYH77937.1 hypothetical protein BO82DRAFT_168483 [Aspergillus uvarum CBS 121591]